MKKIITGFLIGAISATTVTLMADTVTEMISVAKNANAITISGNPLNGDNFTYGGSTYVPVRAVSEALGAEVIYNAQTQTTDIRFPSTEFVTNSEVIDNNEITKTSEIIGAPEIIVGNSASIKSKSITQGDYTISLSNIEPVQNSNVTVLVTGPVGSQYSGKIKFKSTYSDIPITNVNEKYSFSIGRAATGYPVDVVLKVGTSEEVTLTFIPQ